MTERLRPGVYYRGEVFPHCLCGDLVWLARDGWRHVEDNTPCLPVVPPKHKRRGAQP